MPKRPNSNQNTAQTKEISLTMSVTSFTCNYCLKVIVADSKEVEAKPDEQLDFECPNCGQIVNVSHC